MDLSKCVCVFLSVCVFRTETAAAINQNMKKQL